jgi:hypothetical protein
MAMSAAGLASIELEMARSFLSQSELDLKAWDSVNDVQIIGRDPNGPDELLEFLDKVFVFGEDRDLELPAYCRLRELASGGHAWGFDEQARRELLILSNIIQIRFPMAPLERDGVDQESTNLPGREGEDVLEIVLFERRGFTQCLEVPPGMGVDDLIDLIHRQSNEQDEDKHDEHDEHNHQGSSSARARDGPAAVSSENGLRRSARNK